MGYTIKNHPVLYILGSQTGRYINPFSFPKNNKQAWETVGLWIIILILASAHWTYSIIWPFILFLLLLTMRGALCHRIFILTYHFVICGLKLCYALVSSRHNFSLDRVSIYITLGSPLWLCSLITSLGMERRGCSRCACTPSFAQAAEAHFLTQLLANMLLPRVQALADHVYPSPSWFRGQEIHPRHGFHCAPALGAITNTGQASLSSLYWPNQGLWPCE